jgi:hypothetical protein
LIDSRIVSTVWVDLLRVNPFVYRFSTSTKSPRISQAIKQIFQSIHLDLIHYSQHLTQLTFRKNPVLKTKQHMVPGDQSTIDLCIYQTASVF